MKPNQIPQPKKNKKFSFLNQKKFFFFLFANISFWWV